MKKLLLFFLLLIPLASIAQMEGYVSKAVFQNPGNDPYVEFYVTMNSQSMEVEMEKEGYQAGAEVTIIVDNGKVVANYDKFIVYSEARPTAEEVNFFIQTERRLVLSPGRYTAEVIFRDLYDVESSKTIILDPFEVPALADEVMISDIQFVEATIPASRKKDGDQVKGGLVMEPHPLDIFITEEKEIQSYIEVYNLEREYKGQEVLLYYSIKKNGWEEHAGNFIAFSRKPVQPVLAVLHAFNIEDLPAGAYDFVVEVVDQHNTKLAEQRHSFIRSNRNAAVAIENIELVSTDNTFVDEMTSDDLVRYLPALKPIAGDVEERVITSLLDLGKEEAMPKFFLNFWMARNLHNPEGEWLQYKSRVDEADAHFASSSRIGSQTERGRVYLLHGRPTDVFESSFEANSLPYEIWQYDHLAATGETNIYFVFIDEDLISDDYRLIHSNATGEVKDEQWKLKINRNFEFDGLKDFDQTKPRETFGTKSSDLFGDQ